VAGEVDREGDMQGLQRRRRCEEEEEAGSRRIYPFVWCPHA